VVVVMALVVALVGVGWADGAGSLPGGGQAALGAFLCPVPRRILVLKPAYKRNHKIRRLQVC